MKINKIVFNKNYFDAIICLDAGLPDKSFFAHFTGIPIIAADGASIKLLKMDIMPDYIVGDLDTLSKSSLSGSFTGCTIIRIADQETNDFEKSLAYAKKKGYNAVLIAGFHGGELEHTLNNWSVFIKFSHKMQLCIYDVGRYGIVPNDTVSIETTPGEILSLIPQPKALLNTKGLRWNLNDEWLELGTREGARNVAESSNVKISVLDGELLLFLDARLPYAPKKIVQEKI